ncbi:MAG: glutamine synthetase family protein [Pseudomonadota bacterium]
MPDLKSFLTAHPNITHVELVLVDPSGIVRGKWAPVETLEKVFAEGVNFPLSLHGLDIWGNEVPATGLHIESGDLDGFCKAVPHTLTGVPWGGETLADTPEAATNAQVLLQMQRPDHTPFGVCARTVLQNALARCAAKNLTPVCAFELEFHLFTRAEESSITPVGLDDMPDAQFMYGLEALAQHLPVFATIRQAAQWAELPIDTIVKEAGPGQFEINLNHRADALRAADDVILLKRIVREAARAHGLVASFMAKPQAGQPGNGMHVHISMLDGEGENIFSGDEGNTRQRYAVAGLLTTMEEATLVFINTHNGFRRMAPGSYAPTRVNWGENNRSVAVRLPAAPDKAKRVEHRVSGADANPYLVLACLLTAMVDGMEAGHAPPPELVGNAYDEATPHRGVSLPATQREALALFERSDFIARALGGPMQQALTAIKRAEIEGFAGDISPFELNSFL